MCQWPRSAIALALAAGNASAQFTNVVLLRRQPDRQRLVQAGAAARHRTVHDESGAGLVAARRAALRTEGDSRRSGRHQLRARRRARHGLPGVPNSPPTGTATPIAAQVAQLVERRAARPRRAVLRCGAARTTSSSSSVHSARARSRRRNCRRMSSPRRASLVRQVGILNAAGARYIVVFNLPDIGRTPSGVGIRAGRADQRDLRPVQHRADRRPRRARRADDTRQHPGAAERGGAPIPRRSASPTSRRRPAARPRRCSARGESRDAECGEHVPVRRRRAPDEAGHALIAQAVESMIEGPAKIGVLAEAPLAVEQATFRAIDSRMISALDAPVSRGKFEAWVSYDYGRNDFDGRFISGSADVNTVSAGGDIKVTEHMLVGGAFGYADDKGDFGARQRRLHAQGDDRHRVRRLRHGTVVRRRDARCGRPRFSRRTSEFRSRRALPHRKRRNARLARDGQRARRLLVRLRERAARSVRSPRVPADSREGLRRARRRQHGAHLR